MSSICEVARYTAVHIMYDFFNIREITVSINALVPEVPDVATFSEFCPIFSLSSLVGKSDV